jgi:hypothetical protein
MATEHPADPALLPVLRWACDCGRFVAESSIVCHDYIDPGAYYGVSAACSFTCSRCGRVEHMPRLVEIGEQR